MWTGSDSWAELRILLPESLDHYFPYPEVCARIISPTGSVAVRRYSYSAKRGMSPTEQMSTHTNNLRSEDFDYYTGLIQGEFYPFQPLTFVATTQDGDAAQRVIADLCRPICLSMAFRYTRIVGLTMLPLPSAAPTARLPPRKAYTSASDPLPVLPTYMCCGGYSKLVIVLEHLSYIMC